MGPFVANFPDPCLVFASEKIKEMFNAVGKLGNFPGYDVEKLLLFFCCDLFLPAQVVY
jgi:hypothetical protein